MSALSTFLKKMGKKLPGLEDVAGGAGKGVGYAYGAGKHVVGKAPKTAAALGGAAAGYGLSELGDDDDKKKKKKKAYMDDDSCY